jgi:membrane associated rhomboid family serine protease
MTPMVKRLLIICGAVWLLEVIVTLWLNMDAFIVHFALTPARVFPGLEIWQLSTWMWLHSPTDLFHILFNCLFLWMFGGTLELTWGSKAFLRFYLICGIGAGIVVLVFGLIFDPTTKVLGASGAIYGLVAAWAISFPNRIIYFFGIFPMKGKHFALIPIGFAVLDFLTRAQGVSHAAHLGGLAIGALLVTGYWRPSKAIRRLRYIWLRRKLRVLEGDGARKPPEGRYWH